MLCMLHNTFIHSGDIILDIGFGGCLSCRILPVLYLSWEDLEDLVSDLSQKAHSSNSVSDGVMPGFVDTARSCC